MSLKQKTLLGLFWNSSGTVIQSILQVLVLAILARLLTPVDFGLMGAAIVIVGVSTIFSQLGVGPAIIQRAKLESRHLRVAFTVSILFGFSTGAAVYFLAPFISNFFRIKDLIPVLQSLAIIFPIKGFAVVSESLLNRELHFRTLAVVNIISYLIGYAPVGIMLAFMGMGVWALVWATLTQVILNSLILFFIKRCDIRPLLDIPTLKQLLEFGTGYTLVRIGNYSANQGDNIVVGRFLGAGALGVYGRAYQAIMMPVILFGQVLDTVLFPVMAIVQHENKRLAVAFKRSSGLLALILLPLSSFSFILAPEIISLLLGSKWQEVIGPFQILSLGIFFRTSFKMSSSLARATSAVYDCAWRQWVYALLVVLGAWIGQRWGVTGVSVGVLFAIVVNFLLMTQLGLKLSGVSIKDFLREHLSGILLACSISLVVYPITHSLKKIGVLESINLFVSAMSAVILTIILFKKYPRIFLGKNGQWIGELILSRVPEKIKSKFKL